MQNIMTAAAMMVKIKRTFDFFIKPFLSRLIKILQEISPTVYFSLKQVYFYIIYNYYKSDFPQCQVL